MKGAQIAVAAEFFLELAGMVGLTLPSRLEHEHRSPGGRTIRALAEGVVLEIALTVVLARHTGESIVFTRVLERVWTGGTARETNLLDFFHFRNGAFSVGDERRHTDDCSVLRLLTTTAATTGRERQEHQTHRFLHVFPLIFLNNFWSDFPLASRYFYH